MQASHSDNGAAHGMAPELPRRADRVEALARLTSRELEALFLRATLAEGDFLAIAGNPRGRVLAVPGFDRGLTGDLVRHWHGSALYPWEGKSFTATSAREGRGINRFRVPLRRGWFPFRTMLATSRIDQRPCIAIDYDVPSNPWLARGIYDELRALGDALYLGRGGVRRAASQLPSLVLWFLIDARSQDRAL